MPITYLNGNRVKRWYTPSGEVDLGYNNGLVFQKIREYQDIPIFHASWSRVDDGAWMNINIFTGEANHIPDNHPKNNGQCWIADFNWITFPGLSPEKAAQYSVLDCFISNWVGRNGPTQSFNRNNGVMSIAWQDPQGGGGAYDMTISLRAIV